MASLFGTGAAVISLQAQSTFITFSVDMGNNIGNGTFVPGTDTISVHGTFDGWTTGMNLVQQGSSTVYTNTVNDTVDANGTRVLYKFVDSHANVGYENLCDGGGNRGAALPAVSGSSLTLPTPFFGDSGTPVTYTSTITFQVDMSEQIHLGNFVPGTSTVDVSGNFNGWSQSAPLTNDPTIIETTPGGLLTSNVYVGTFTSAAVSTNAHMAYQYVLNGTSYEGESAANSDGGGNRYFTMLPTNQTNSVVFYADDAYAPSCTLTFGVDMSAVVLTDTNFNPASVTINGDQMGWGGVAMTNNPSAANTNIYYATFTFGQGSSVNYQYRYTELSSGSTIYDHANGVNGGQGNRFYQVPAVEVTNVPTVFFNDANLDDYLTQPTPVTFSVDMANAVDDTGYAFDPSSDNVYLNGAFVGWYAWAGGANPAPAPTDPTVCPYTGGSFQMFEEGLSTIYTNTLVMPAGTPVGLTYKYGLDKNAYNSGPLDDEATSGNNHYRVVRTTAISPYPLPADTFGKMYDEPLLSSGATGSADLAVGAESGNTVPISWLGRPGAHLQTSTNLAGAWQDVWATDGTNWTAGYFNPTNGFVSVTNWPAAGKTFFRLVKP